MATKPSWISVNPDSGTKAGSSNVTAMVNTATNGRTGTITVKTASGLSKFVSVSQKKAPYTLNWEIRFQANCVNRDSSAHIIDLCVVSIIPLQTFSGMFATTQWEPLSVNANSESLGTSESSGSVKSESSYLTVNEVYITFEGDYSNLEQNYCSIRMIIGAGTMVAAQTYEVSGNSISGIWRNAQRFDSGDIVSISAEIAFN